MTSESKPSSFDRLAAIDCNNHIESKNGFNYLSWAWAVSYLLKEDPTASWHYQFWNEKPYCDIGGTAMVFCTVKSFGIDRTAQLPIMNYKNQPIVNPNAFEVNTAMQRCLAKGIALHGLGLYIYQGEDLEPDTTPKSTQKKDGIDYGLDGADKTHKTTQNASVEPVEVSSTWEEAVSVLEYDKRSGKTAKGPWTKHGFRFKVSGVDEEFWGGTFDQKLSDILTPLVGTPEEIVLKFETKNVNGKENYNILESLGVLAP